MTTTAPYHNFFVEEIRNKQTIQWWQCNIPYLYCLLISYKWLKNTTETSTKYVTVATLYNKNCPNDNKCLILQEILIRKLIHVCAFCRNGRFLEKYFVSHVSCRQAKLAELIIEIK